MVLPFTLIDLFAGCGGMTSGFTADGLFTPVQAVEWNLHAAATYAANYGESHTIWGDISKIANEDIRQADVVIGGPPCQGFSNLGSKDVNDPRNKLWREYLRFVQVAQPKVFVIENVARFMASSEFALLLEEEAHGLLRDYTLTYAVLNAADYGVPQRRQRAIVIGSRIGKIEMPTATHSQSGEEGRLPWATVRSAIEGLPKTPEHVVLPASVEEFFGETVPGTFKGLDLHIGRRPTDRSLLRYDCIPPGGGRFDLPDELLPDCWRNKATGTTDVMGRMRWDQPSLTIRTEFFKPEKGQYLHPQWERTKPRQRVNRVITHYEASLLQQFPSDYLWAGSKIEIAKQIGNAVPTGLARAIAGHLHEHLSS
ncbi:DNA cytosine methyltransferase [Acidothermaceae bacterium B102]|nr:DNA cytosine methyltransferase [Acidothermaceae bacterium B102]